MSLAYGSLFSGGGGMDLGFERAGFRCAWQSEIDKDAVSVLKRHWPDVPQLGSVTDVRGDLVEPVDAIIGGFPCQDLSLAGKRKGLSGERSGLFYEFLRIVGEMRDATHGRYPAVAVFENVDGLLSSHAGRDFAHVLAGLQERGAAVAYRVLDAQFFGVPQRRRRVFIVADFAPVGVGEERAAAVLALRESLCGHPEAGAEARQGSAGAAEDGAGVGRPYAVSENQRAELRLTDYVYSLTGGGGKPGQGFAAVLEPLPFDARNGVTIDDIASPLQAGNGDGRGWSLNCAPLIAEPVAAFGGNRTSGPLDVAACLSTSTQRLDFETQTLIVAPWDEAQITSVTNRSRVEDGAACPTLHQGGTVGIVAAEVASAITASAGHHGHSSPRGDGSDNLVAEAQAFAWQAGGGDNDTSFRGKSRQYIGALGVTRQDAVAYGFYPTGGTRGVGATLDGIPPLKVGKRADFGGTPGGVAYTDSAGLRWIVRRLTPTEGERCQGWPDDWTRYRDDGREISDSARWRMIGNGVATPVAEWLARRLKAALEAS